MMSLDPTTVPSTLRKNRSRALLCRLGWVSAFAGMTERMRAIVPATTSTSGINPNHRRLRGEGRDPFGSLIAAVTAIEFRPKCSVYRRAYAGLSNGVLDYSTHTVIPAKAETQARLIGRSSSSARTHRGLKSAARYMRTQAM